jgi:hypothetical protein
MSTSAKSAVKVQDLVAQALQLSERLQLLLSNETQHVIKTNRDGLCLLHWSLIFEHHQGILVLLQQRLPAPAFALLRPLEEAFLRSFVVMHGTDKQAEAIKNGKYKTQPEIIGNQIDQKLGLMKAHFGPSFKTKMPVLHGFTHGGKEQLVRQASGLDIVSSYTDDEISTLVKETMWVVFLAALFITDFLGYPAENQAAMQMLNEYLQGITSARA